jgi:hypothetical protein
MNTKTSNYEPHLVPGTKPGGNEVRYVPHTPPWNDGHNNFQKIRTLYPPVVIDEAKLREKGVIQ